VAITRRIARPMIAGMFISGGIDALQHPEAKAARAAPVAEKLSEPLGLTQEPVTLIRVNGAVMVVGGLLLGAGKIPRLASIALAASLVPTTFAGHRFWEIEDPQQRAQQRVHFLKNISMLGGLILAATDTEGRPSLSWRARRKAHKALEALPIPSSA
jgi:putative oxidoreductase